MIIENTVHPAVDRVLAEMADAYHLTEERAGIHCTDVIYCLRKSYWNKTAALPPSPLESIHFLTGLGLQDTLLRRTTPSLCVDGMWVSADYYDNDVVLEMKTTMIGEKRLMEHDFPEGWIVQMKAYCYAYATETAVLLVIPLLTKKPVSFIFHFTKEELEDNWCRLQERLEELASSLLDKAVPKTKGFEWECKDCRYRLRCQILDSKGEER